MMKLIVDVYAVDNDDNVSHAIPVIVRYNMLTIMCAYDEIKAKSVADFVSFSSDVDGLFYEKFNAKISVSFNPNYRSNISKHNKGYLNYLFYAKLTKWEIIKLKFLTKNYAISRIDLSKVLIEVIMVTTISLISIKTIKKIAHLLEAWLSSIK